jgi:CSLREA domain-containing protein
VVTLAFALPSLAQAATFTVDTTADSGGCGASEACSLRGAIEAANALNEGSTIDFGVTGTIAVSGTQLHQAFVPIDFDGTTAPGYAGSPLVTIEWAEAFSATTEGLSFGSDAVGSSVEGLAIEGFGKGIWVGASGVGVCGDYLGMDESGFGIFGAANGVGIEVGTAAHGTEIGAGCGGTGGVGGNFIVNSEEAGIRDEGVGTRISANSIGTDPRGFQVPNKAAGVFLTEESEEAFVGGDGTDPGNTIAGNGDTDTDTGPGVKVFVASVAKAKISRNSIHDNAGKGIEIEQQAPTPPSVTAVSSPGAGQLTFEGTVTATAAETVEVEFFGNEECDAGGAGEGQTYLGSATVVTAGAETKAFAETVATTIPLGEEEVTATAIGSTPTTRTTSEFSTCATYVHPSRTFTVNTLADSPAGVPDPGECEGAAVCTLRDAIEYANRSPAADTIGFAVSGAIQLQGENGFEIEAPVKIDGITAPGWAGKPVVEADGSGLQSEGSILGFEIESGGSGSEILGLAIGGFQFGITVANGATGQLCGDYIGVETDGTTANPNRAIAINTGNGSPGTRIGAGCGALGGNLISGNNTAIADFGTGTAIAGNRIGVDANGAPLPNTATSGAVLVGNTADGTAIGDVPATAADAPNEIADNAAAGIQVESIFANVSIRANSIHGNGGKGIGIGPEHAPAPAIASVAAAAGRVTVAGSLTGAAASAEYALEFFANAVCGPGGSGQGQTFLGAGTTTTDASGKSTYSSDFAATIPAAQDQITATATNLETGATTEFSTCHTFVPPEKPEEPEEPEEPENAKEPVTPAQPAAPPQQPAQAAVTPLTETGPVPVNGESVVVSPAAGKVKIKFPGKGKFVPLVEIQEIPVGAIVDATNGKVRLTSIGPDGTEQSAVFFGGFFRVVQRDGKGLVVLELLDRTPCVAPPAAGRASASAAGRSSGKLWGSGHGNFRTEGSKGAATVRGTIWLVEDRCDGTTFFRTRRGVVSVRDFATGKTIPVPAGKTYTAGGG